MKKHIGTNRKRAFAMAKNEDYFNMAFDAEKTFCEIDLSSPYGVKTSQLYSFRLTTKNNTKPV